LSARVLPFRASWIAFLALTWAVSGLSPAGAQSNGVPNEKTLEESLRKKPVTPKATPNPATTKKVAEPAGASPAPPKPAHRGTLIPMVVVSDAACALEVNGDPIGALEPDAVKKLSVYPGDQLVKCASAEEPGEIYSAVQNIKAGEQTVLQIGLAARIAAVRQKREAQTQSLAAEDELWGQAGEHGSAANLQAYLDKYPTGRFADQAKEYLTAATRPAQVAQPEVARPEAARPPTEITIQLPARPDLPFPVGDDIWRALENSPYYMNLPHRTRKVTVSVSSTVHGAPVTGSSVNWSQVSTREIVPLGDRCVMLHTVTRKSEASDVPPDVMDEYQCGELKLETVVSGKVIRAASLSDVETFLQDDKAAREKPPCEVPNSGPASAFHAALTGTATRYGCGSGEYYFEDLGVWLYELGEMDPQKQQYVLPSPGYHFESVADGDSGGKITTTFDAFSWAD
jgi:hypothetical protein